MPAGPPHPDHVCLADDGAEDGRCAPIVGYDGCDPATHPVQPGRVRAEGLDVDEPGELGFLRDVVRVEGNLSTVPSWARPSPSAACVVCRGCSR